MSNRGRKDLEAAREISRSRGAIAGAACEFAKKLNALRASDRVMKPYRDLESRIIPLFSPWVEDLSTDVVSNLQGTQGIDDENVLSFNAYIFGGAPSPIRITKKIIDRTIEYFGAKSTTPRRSSLLEYSVWLEQPRAWIPHVLTRSRGQILTNPIYDARDAVESNAEGDPDNLSGDTLKSVLNVSLWEDTAERLNPKSEYDITWAGVQEWTIAKNVVFSFSHTGDSALTEPIKSEYRYRCEINFDRPYLIRPTGRLKELG